MFKGIKRSQVTCVKCLSCHDYVLLFSVISNYFLQEKQFCESKATVHKPTNKWLVRLAMIRNVCLIWFIQEDRVKRRILFYASIVRDEFHHYAWMEANSTLCHWPNWQHVVFWHVQLDFSKELVATFSRTRQLPLGPEF